LVRISHPTQILGIGFTTLAHFNRFDLFVTVAVLCSKKIGSSISKLIVLFGVNNDTLFPITRLYVPIFSEELPGFVIVNLPTGSSPGLVFAISQLLSHHRAVVSQFSYIQRLFGRSTLPFPQ
jgi:hypothetical protein